MDARRVELVVAESDGALAARVHDRKCALHGRNARFAHRAVELGSSVPVWDGPLQRRSPMPPRSLAAGAPRPIRFDFLPSSARRPWSPPRCDSPHGSHRRRRGGPQCPPPATGAQAQVRDTMREDLKVRRAPVKAPATSLAPPAATRWRSRAHAHKAPGAPAPVALRDVVAGEVIPRRAPWLANGPCGQGAALQRSQPLAATGACSLLPGIHAVGAVGDLEGTQCRAMWD